MVAINYGVRAELSFSANDVCSGSCHHPALPRLLAVVEMSFSAGPNDETFSPTTLQAGVHKSITGLLVSSGDGKPKCKRFCQIPYALPPAGQHRWRPPRAVSPELDWSEIPATDFGKIACQPTYQIGLLGQPPMSSHMKGRELGEDSLTANVWTPVGTPPQGGWPVYVYLHGGWLQIGNPAFTDKNNCSDMLGEAGMKVIYVSLGYRLSLFGFLASKELREENESGCAGNFGFMDQRMGIEWVHENIHHFGGNPEQITVGGQSAGAYSTHFQLCYELNFPVRPIFKRIIQFSNAIPAQPKSVEESQAAFDGLLEAFGIPLDLTSREKMSRLRAISAEDLMDITMKLQIHTFRAVTDDVFVHRDTMKRHLDGTSAKQFKERDMSIIIGEVDREELLYSCTNPPEDKAALEVQLHNYYATAQVRKILSLYPKAKAGDLQTLHMLYGQMVADGQVYVPSRVFVQQLFDAGVGMDKILRYRIAWKPKAMSRIEIWPGAVTHSDDTWCWWYLRRFGYSEDEAETGRAWIAPLQAFYDGDLQAASKLWWGTEAPPTRPDVIRILKGEKEIVVRDDDRWERSLRIAEAVRVVEV